MHSPGRPSPEVQTEPFETSFCKIRSGRFALWTSLLEHKPSIGGRNVERVNFLNQPVLGDFMVNRWL